jgi:hypothetical protein
MVEGVRALIVSGGHLLWAAPKQLPIIWPRGTTYALDGIHVDRSTQQPMSAGPQQSMRRQLPAHTNNNMEAAAASALLNGAQPLGKLGRGACVRVYPCTSVSAQRWMRGEACAQARLALARKEQHSTVIQEVCVLPQCPQS